ncbi:MAG: hypothetical protein IH977_05585 [Nitrospinae bacterium]|nr:hypothetical protein [Nitrospinota bacterium]
MTDHSKDSTLFNPFPGLRPFEMDEDYLFFGREGQTDELLRRLRQTRFLAVVGTSGSGKSSLVRAGMLPALHGGMMTSAGSSWRIAVMRPGDDPFGHLAEVLVKPDALEGGQTENTEQTEKDKTTRLKAPMIEATLRRSSLGIVEATRQTGLSQQGNLLIVVDQFEELFRFQKATKETKGRDEAAGFVKLLLEAAKQEEESIYVVLTMRSDFLGDCAQFRDLPEALNDGQYLIPRMTQDQRREAITGPVAVGGGAIAPRLVQRLLNDVGDDPDQLPILQHALMRTWKEWEKDGKNGNPIDIQEYEAVGGLSDALSNHAQDAYDTLPDVRSQRIAEKLFKCLTEKGPDNREIRRPTTVKQIAAVANAEPAEVTQVINQFRSEDRSFLMPPVTIDLNENTLIDISHESLIRQWKTLRKWVEEEADSRVTYLRIVDAAIRRQEGSGGLWRNPELSLAVKWKEVSKPNETWASLYGGHFPQAMKFLESSQKEHAAEQRKKQWIIAGMVTLILAVIGALAWGFVTQKQAALKAQRAAILIAASEKIQAGRPTIAALLVTELADGVEPYGGSATAHEVATSALSESILAGHTGTVTHAAFSPDGTKIVTASDDGTARAWPADGQGEPMVLKGHTAL